MNGRRKWFLVVAFLLSAALTVMFAFRAVHHRPHRRVDEPIRPWMTVGYVAHSYHVPAHVLYEALGIQHRPHDKLTIARVAREQNRPVASVINDLMEAIDRARPNATGSPPGPGHSPASPSSTPQGGLRPGGGL